MQLFVYVLNQKEKLDDVLEGFVEIGLPGATVLDSVGMGRILSQDPVFAGFQTMLANNRPDNKTILTVVDDEAKVDRALALIEELCGPFGVPGAGIAFTIRLERVVGLRPETH